MRGLLSIFLGLLLSAAPFSSKSQAGNEKRSVDVRFVQSPYADYLFYLLYRSSGPFTSLETAVPMGNIPTLDQLISLPEQTVSAQPTSYHQLYPIVRRYREATKAIVPLREGGALRFRKLAFSDALPSYETLDAIVHQGESHYPTFQAFWEQNIAPAERQQIDVWKEQVSACSPLDKLQDIERLSFPFPTMDIGAIALHLSGSGNTYPVGIYTSLFTKANLPWVIGHEATHLMVDEHAGHNWHSHPLAEQAIDLVKHHAGKANDIEESLALFMQLKLSQTCGYTDPARRMSDNFDAKTPTGAILRSLEAGWDSYQTGKQNIIDYTIQQTLIAWPRSSSAPSAALRN